MVIIRVVTNVDGKTKKKPGKISTEIIQRDRRYAVESIYDVIANLQIIVPENENLIAIIEEHSAVFTL